MPAIAIGLSPSFTPAEGFTLNTISDLVAWYKADTGVNIDGATGNVASWEDQSATGDEVQALITSAQPQFVASVAGLNGQPSLQFISTGGADPNNMALVSAAVLLTAAHTTTFAVVQLLGTTGMLAPCITSDATSPTPRLRALTDGTVLRWELGTGPSLSDGPVDLNPHLVMGEFGATGIIRIDGVETANGPLFAREYDGMTIGAGPPTATPTDPPTYSWNGYIAEIAIYNRGLLLSEILQIEAALMEKYDLP